MHWKSLSDNNPDTGENVPVTVFTHGTKRKLMATPQDYNELVRIVKRKFNIPANSVPIFQTRAPTRETRERFEIDDTAYPLIRQYLDEVLIAVEPASGEDQATDMEIDTSAVAEEDEEDEIQTIIVNNKGKGKAKPSPVSTGGEASKPRTFSPAKPLSKPPLFIPSNSSGSSKTFSPDLQPASTGSDSRALSVDPHDLFNDDVPVDNHISPKKTKTKGKAKEPEPEVFDVDAQEAEATPIKSEKAPVLTKKNSSSEWEDIEELPKAPERDEDEEDVFGKTPKGAKATHNKRGESSTMNAEASVTVKKEKLGTAGSASTVRQSALLSQIDALTQSQSATAVPEEPSQIQQSQSSDQDPRFKITIIGPGNERAEFMTRRKHTLRKVLAGACRNFNIDPTRAQLKQVLEVDDEDSMDPDGKVEQLFPCDVDDSVGRAGIGPESKLRLVVEDEEDLDVSFQQDDDIY
ncbi:hypothetical protein BT96DRAFT_924562 [Gymnopus androsaceus JB14]|uniref:Uncharacterized protein n=1 Tax=Gymnopus androsaceus JB14 TaxID=1447944 RepID=A0A6A4H5V9_9AGAR|nr:hypothetical protein BT96DRAFT_924562 [Gymnopus androsaceus JB14]